jgi:hypothetical protein
LKEPEIVNWITFKSSQPYSVQVSDKVMLSHSQKTDKLPSWFDCAKSGHVDGILEHIRRGVNIDQVDQNSYTALHWAARNAAFYIIPVSLCISSCLYIQDTS